MTVANLIAALREADPQSVLTIMTPDIDCDMYSPSSVVIDAANNVVILMPGSDDEDETDWPAGVVQKSP